MNMENLQQRLERKASIMVIGGLPPPKDPAASWFGKVRLARPSELWPAHRGKPMLPLCQINCSEMPYCPDHLSDLALITVFVSQDELPLDAPNGEGWELRAYTRLHNLIEIAEPEHSNPIKPFPIQWQLCENDYPCLDDVTIELSPEVEENFEDLFENQSRSKIGGWPTLIQSEIYWAPWNKHPANPEYVFQINSEEKANWWWGDAGVGHVGRGTGAAKNQWALSWQCY